MTQQHSMVEHRANYFYVRLEDDYLAMCARANAEIEALDLPERQTSGPADCKSMMCSVLEHWMNSKRLTAKCEDDLYVYFTYDEWEHQLRYRYTRSTIIRCLNEMEKEGQWLDEQGEIHVGLIKKRHYVQNTFAYILNIPVVQGLINQLPEQSPYGPRPKAVLGRPRKNHSKINGINLNRLKTDGINEIPSENTRNNAEIPSKNKRSFYTQINNIDLNKTQISESAADAIASSPTHHIFCSPETSKPPVPLTPSIDVTQASREGGDEENVLPHLTDHHGDTGIQCDPVVDAGSGAAEYIGGTEPDSDACASHRTEITTPPATGESGGRKRVQPEKVTTPSRSVANSASEGKKSSRKPTKAQLLASKKERIAKVYEEFDQLAQEATGNSTYHYPKYKKTNEAIAEWLDQRPTPQLLRTVYQEMAKDKRDPRSGFCWADHMDIESVIKQCNKRALAIQIEQNKQKKQVTPLPTMQVEYEEEVTPSFVLMNRLKAERSARNGAYATTKH